MSASASPRLTLAVSQCHTLSTLARTLAALSHTAHAAAKRGVDLLLFPEAYLGGYPRGCNFGAAVGAREELGREQFLNYWRETVDLGDTPRGEIGWAGRAGEKSGGDGKEGAGDEREAEQGAVTKGDGTREQLEEVAQATGLFLVVGLVEKAGGSLYCSVVYVCPRRGCVGKRRKVMPTGTERLIWAQGDPATLRAVTANIKGVRLRLAAAICWENYMPLLRFSLYSQNVNLYLAPTADARDTWLPLMQTVALEGRCFVLSANQCVRADALPGWIHSSPKATSSADGTSQAHRTSGHKGISSDSQNHDPDLKTKPLGRRRSIITKTQDNHEITWPTGPRETMARRRSSFAISEGPHELVLPAVGGQESASGISEQSSVCPHKPLSSSSEPTAATTVSSAPFACRGGSCIIGPTGAVLAGPLWEEPDGLLVAEVDFEDCIKGRLDFDAAGSYSRSDAFELKVRGLNLDPPA